MKTNIEHIDATGIITNSHVIINNNFDEIIKNLNLIWKNLDNINDNIDFAPLKNANLKVNADTFYIDYTTNDDDIVNLEYGNLYTQSGLDTRQNFTEEEIQERNENLREAILKFFNFKFDKFFSVNGDEKEYYGGFNKNIYGSEMFIILLKMHFLLYIMSMTSQNRYYLYSIGEIIDRIIYFDEYYPNNKGELVIKIPTYLNNSSDDVKEDYRKKVIDLIKTTLGTLSDENEVYDIYMYKCFTDVVIKIIKELLNTSLNLEEIRDNFIYLSPEKNELLLLYNYDSKESEEIDYAELQKSYKSQKSIIKESIFSNNIEKYMYDFYDIIIYIIRTYYDSTEGEIIINKLYNLCSCFVITNEKGETNISKYDVFDIYKEFIIYVIRDLYGEGSLNEILKEDTGNTNTGNTNTDNTNTGNTGDIANNINDIDLERKLNYKYGVNHYYIRNYNKKIISETEIVRNIIDAIDSKGKEKKFINLYKNTKTQTTFESDVDSCEFSLRYIGHDIDINNESYHTENMYYDINTTNAGILLPYTESEWKVVSPIFEIDKYKNIIYIYLPYAYDTLLNLKYVKLNTNTIIGNYNIK